MKQRFIFLFLLTSAFGCQRTPEQGSSFAAERSRARLYPYANDLGPNQIDVSEYPEALRQTYQTLILNRCARCHEASRVLNSQFIEPPGDDQAQVRIVKVLKKVQPQLFADSKVWQVEPRQADRSGIWERYIRRMMAKPGSGITAEDAKKIWQFLTYDSIKRKTGPQAEVWAAQRQTQLDEFKKKHPFRYKELYGE